MKLLGIAIAIRFTSRVHLADAFHTISHFPTPVAHGNGGFV